MPTETKQTVEAAPQYQQVVLPHPQAGNPNYLPIFPELSTVVSHVDRYARRVPWWFWVGGTLFAVWYAGKRSRRGKVIHLDD